jgi:cell division septation protein DedD
MADTENNPSNRQIVYLFLGFVILFIFTFSLGVIVGKGLGGSKTQITSEEVPPKTSGKDVQEFEETTQIITGKELPSESPTAPIQEEMIEVEEEVNIQIPPSGPFEKQIETKRDKPTSSELLSKQPPSTVEPIEKKPELETNKVEPIKKDIAASPTIPPTPVAPAVKKPELEKKEIEAKITPTPPPIEKQTKLETKKVEPIKKDIAALPAIQPGGRYTVQIGAFQKEGEAKQIVNNLKSKGYPAFIKTSEIPGKGIWYRVRIGTFTTRVTAKLYAANLKNIEPFIKFVFITVNN